MEILKPASGKLERILPHIVHSIHCLYTNAQNVRNKQGKFELSLQKFSYDLIDIMKPGWNSADKRQFVSRGAEATKKGGGFAVCSKHHTAYKEDIRIQIIGGTNKSNTIVEFYYQQFSQKENADDTSPKQWQNF